MSKLYVTLIPCVILASFIFDVADGVVAVDTALTALRKVFGKYPDLLRRFNDCIAEQASKSWEDQSAVISCIVHSANKIDEFGKKVKDPLSYRAYSTNNPLADALLKIIFEKLGSEAYTNCRGEPDGSEPSSDDILACVCAAAALTVTP